MPSNGSAHPPQPAAVNRKKQKRREKEAAKKAAQDPVELALPLKNGSSPALAAAHAHGHTRPAAPQYSEPELDEPQYDDEAEFYSDEEVEHYEGHVHGANGHYQPAYGHASIATGSTKKSKRRRRPGQQAPPPLAYTQHTAPRHNPTPAHPRTHAHSHTRNNGQVKHPIWNTSTDEERERIREFWLSLGEDERKSLVKIEKEAVLRKMKEQQKHSCSCSVCGRKRTAIEEELEVLYDAYYEELEQYAHLQQDVGSFLPDANYRHVSSAPHPRPLMTTHPPPAHGHRYADEDDEEEDEEEDEEYSGEEEDYSNSEISSEGDYSSEERSLPPPEAADFLHFGSSLQVKGGILTVADDLLKNDGKKFIEMMEQLAERRMQREEEAQYQAHPSMYQTHNAHGHGPPPEEDDFEDEGDEEEGYEDEDYEEDDEDEDVRTVGEIAGILANGLQDTMTEEQRMEEGRRMFQIFAARMFEQRVLQAYREKVAAERQQRLLQELAEEDERKDLKEAKKLKEAQKRKEKKEKLRQQKAEAQARKEAEQAAKEAELKAAEEKRQEEQRKKREEARKKKEAERKAQEEEKQRKEAERQRRQHEERERQQEAERKAREAKAQEKKAKDEAKRKEREAREAKEKEAKEKRIQEDKERKERDAKAKADRQAAASGTRKASQPPVALPPQLLKQTSSSGMSSPHVTPALPKAPTPNRPRQTSQQGSHGSSPNTPQAAPKPSKSASPSNAHGPTMPRSILTKPVGQQQNHLQQGNQLPPMPPFGPPPGMPGPPGLNMGAMPPGLNGFPGQGSMMPGMMGPRPGMPPFPPQLGTQSFRGFPPPGMPMGRGFPMDGPPGFGPMPGFGGPTQIPGFGMAISPHSRQGSGSLDRLPSSDSPSSGPQAQPIQRPTPIKRPSSNKAPDDESRPNVDDLADHLGSKALLDDAEDIPEPPERRASVQQHGSFRGTPMGFGFADSPMPSRNDSFSAFGAPGGNIWGTPPMPFSLGSGASWGNSPTSGFFNNPFPVGNIRGNERGPNEQRIVWLRRLVCSACKMAAARQPTQDGYVEASEVHQQVNNLRNPSEPVITADEIKEACDIIDTTQTNGGGSLEYKESGPGRLSHIKFVDVAAPAPATLGEIGSPVPSHSVLVGGFGNPRPFPGLGPQGF
ncbi:Stress response protein nst1 [Curvularia kusanoi]|uniref:Stress response protein NST1 n=1 Tax=Curvularia kusanoi TaxID=90978 RepID=A0A9P4WAL8_CURKU|nr:Stress response protein nst1 [Curvularia kusanoi]